MVDISVPYHITIYQQYILIYRSFWRHVVFMHRHTHTPHRVHTTWYIMGQIHSEGKPYYKPNIMKLYFPIRVGNDMCSAVCLYARSLCGCVPVWACISHSCACACACVCLVFMDSIFYLFLRGKSDKNHVSIILFCPFHPILLCFYIFFSATTTSIQLPSVHISRTHPLPTA